MKDGVRTEEQVEVSRTELYEDYLRWYLQAEDVRPCRDDHLLQRAARFLRREPEERRGTFTVFPFYQAVTEGCDAPSPDCRKRLSAFIKAAELLETICVNLLLHPWRKEIKTLKTFTGPFVYCLLPVFSTAALQSVLASIGYLPDTDTPPSEFRLSEDAHPDRATLVGFEMLLARVECLHLLELLDADQLGPQECLELLQRRAGPTKQEKPAEKKTTAEQNEEKEEEEEEEKKDKGADRREPPPYLDTRLAVNPQPKPRRSHIISSPDQSIMEVYPDLAIRGRPLLPHKRHRAAGSRGGGKPAHTAAAAATDNHGDDGKAAELHRGDEGRSSGRTPAPPGDPPIVSSSSFSHADGGRAGEELRQPPGTTLHITLRAGATAETAAERPSSPASSLDEEKELRELEERMGQLHVQDAREEVKRKEEESAKKDRRKKERVASADRDAEEQRRFSDRPEEEQGYVMIV